ncbi:MAG: hypothetical protein DRJ69_06150 [Thermoprotei archaeon]|nr:MAG: hypothetical protein DRJ69_06150 [Thermoprotei archaeon]
MEFQEGVLYCIAYLIAKRVPSYKILEDILINPGTLGLARGDQIRFTQDYFVGIIWPPRELPERIRPKLVEIVKGLYEEVSRRAEEEGISEEVNIVFWRLREQLRKLFVEEPRRIYDEERRITSAFHSEIWFTSNEARRAIDKELRWIVDRLRRITDHISLVMKGYSDNCLNASLFLVAGDTPDYVLNYLWQLEEQEFQDERYRRVLFLRAAHHGTRFGEYLRRHEAAVAYASWTKHVSIGARLWRYMTMLQPLLFITAEDVPRFKMNTCRCPLQWPPHIHPLINFSLELQLF